MGFVARVCQPSTLRMLICPEASSAQNNIAAVSADGRTVWVLIRRLNSSCKRSIALVVRTLRHWPGGRRAKVNKRSPASSRLSGGNSGVLEPPFSDKGLAADLDLLRSRGIDHVVVIRGDLVMQALGCMREKISVLVNSAALHRPSVPDRGKGLVEPRRTVDNEELGPPQPALDEIVEDSAPGLGALAAHALDREQHLLAVRAHAEDNEERDRGRLAVEPHANDGAVEDQTRDRLLGQRAGVPGVPVALHLAPRPAHRVL